jgi:hypothetical protein
MGRQEGRAGHVWLLQPGPGRRHHQPRQKPAGVSKARMRRFPVRSVPRRCLRWSRRPRFSQEAAVADDAVSWLEALLSDLSLNAPHEVLLDVDRAEPPLTVSCHWADGPTVEPVLSDGVLASVAVAEQIQRFIDADWNVVCRPAQTTAAHSGRSAPATRCIGGARPGMSPARSVTMRSCCGPLARKRMPPGC